MRIRGDFERLKSREVKRPFRSTAEMRSIAVSTDPLPANRSRQISHSGDDVSCLLTEMKRNNIFASLLYYIPDATITLHHPVGSSHVLMKGSLTLAGKLELRVKKQQ